MTFEEIKALDHQYVMQSYGRFDVAVDHGRGATLWDTQGREYIDFTSGIGVCSIGYANPSGGRRRRPGGEARACVQPVLFRTAGQGSRSSDKEDGTEEGVFRKLRRRSQ